MSVVDLSRRINTVELKSFRKKSDTVVIGKYAFSFKCFGDSVKCDVKKEDEVIHSYTIKYNNETMIVFLPGGRINTVDLSNKRELDDFLPIF